MFKQLWNIFRAQREPVALNPQDVVSAYNATRKKELRGSFCYAPSVNMLFSQDGSVFACCHNLETSVGRYPDMSISQIWKSAQANAFRQRMERFDLSHGCSICKADLETHNFQEIRAGHFDRVPRHAQYPTMMEFVLTNTCNLECVMCKGEYSSMIRQNREKLPPIRSPYDERFLEQLKEFIPYLHETRFSGSGEAFAIDMNYRIWDMLLQQNPGCIIMVQTNGTFLNSRIKDYLERGNFQIGVSLDSLKKEVYEGIRVHASFDKVLSNIDYFSDYCRKRKQKFVLAMCVMRENWRELPDFVNFANTKDAVVNFHKVWFPVENALHNLSADKLKEIYEYLSARDVNEDGLHGKWNRRHYHYMVSVIKQWLDKALELGAEGRLVDTLHESELLPYFEKKLRQQLGYEDLTEERRKEMEMYMSKVKTVVDYPGLPADRLTILKTICLVPPAELEIPIKTKTAEELIADLSMFVTQNAAVQN